MYLITLNYSLCILISSGRAAMAFYESEMPDKYSVLIPWLLLV